MKVKYLKVMFQPVEVFCQGCFCLGILYLPFLLFQFVKAPLRFVLKIYRSRHVSCLSKASTLVCYRPKPVPQYARSHYEEPLCLDQLEFSLLILPRRLRQADDR